MKWTAGEQSLHKNQSFLFIWNTHTNLHASIYFFLRPPQPRPCPSLMAWSLGHGQKGAFLRSQAPTVPLENYRGQKRKGSRDF